MEGIKYFIWDFDGTLFNTYPSIASTLVNIIKKFYKKELEFNYIKQMCQTSLNFCINRITEELNINKEKFAQEFVQEYSNIEESEEKPFTGALEILKFIKRKGGKNFIVTHRRKYRLFKLLKFYKMENLFDDIITSENGFLRKPDPKSFLFLIDKYKISRNNVISIGDRDIDIQTAKSINIKSCYFNPNGKTHHLANFSISSLLKLKEIINV